MKTRDLTVSTLEQSSIELECLEHVKFTHGIDQFVCRATFSQNDTSLLSVVFEVHVGPDGFDLEACYAKPFGEACKAVDENDPFWESALLNAFGTAVVTTHIGRIRETLETFQVDVMA